MKNILTIMAVFYATIIFSQVNNSVTVELINMHYSSNGNSIPQCGIIDLESEDSVQIQFEIVLTRGYVENETAYNNQYKSGSLVIKAYSSSSGIIEYSTTYINEYNWNLGNGIQTINLNEFPSLNSAEYGVSDNQFYAEFYSSGDVFSSCDYSIIKDEVPAFQISPSSTIVSCGSTTPKHFNVLNTNNSPGTLEYEWSVSNGWKNTNGDVVYGVFTTSSSNLTLVPYQYPPSNVHVTPKLDGIPYEQLTSNVSLSSFNPNNQIIGNNTVCSTANYHLQNSLPNGWSVNWSLESTNIASITQNGNNATVTRNFNQSGNITIKATIINSCNQTVSKTLDVFVGKPVVNSFGINGGWDNVPVESSSYFSVHWVQGNNINYRWSITPYNANGPRFTANNSTSLTSSSRYVSINWGTDTETYSVSCKAINSCSQTYLGNKLVNVFDAYNNPCPTGSGGLESSNYQLRAGNNDNFEIIVFPNPTSNGDINIKKTKPIGSDILRPCNGSGYSNRTSFNNIKIEILNHIEIYDLYGNIVFKKTFNTENITISNLNLKKGTYFLKFTDSYGISKKETLQIN